MTDFSRHLRMTNLLSSADERPGHGLEQRPSGDPAAVELHGQSRANHVLGRGAQGFPGARTHAMISRYELCLRIVD